MIVHTQVLVGNDGSVIPEQFYWEDASVDLHAIMTCYRKPEYGTHIILATGDQMVIKMPYRQLRKKLDQLNKENTIFFSKPNSN